MERFTLTMRQRQEMQRSLTHCSEQRVCRRLLALLDVDRGRSIAEIARSLQVDRRSIHNWVRAYRLAGGVEALSDQPRPGRPSLWDDALRTLLEEVLRKTPFAYGYRATTWTVPLLQQFFQQRHNQPMAESTLRRALHGIGYSWKRSRYVLAPDPQEDKKKIPQETLANAGLSGGCPGRG